MSLEAKTTTSDEILEEKSDDVVGEEEKVDDDGSKECSVLFSYSAKDLKRIKESRASRRWPEFLDQAFRNSRGHWDR